MKVKEESEKAGLKLNIQKTTIMASGPISSVQFSLVAQSCPTLCDLMNCSMPGLPVHHHLPDFTQTQVTSWQIDAEAMETVTDFFFFTADGDCCSHEIKRFLLLGRKVMTNLHSLLKSRDITLPTKVHLFQAMVFPVVMYGCESWTIRKAECWRIDVFELWCWRILLRVPWTERRSNQSILKEISPEYSLERLMLKLKY